MEGEEVLDIFSHKDLTETSHDIGIYCFPPWA